VPAANPLMDAETAVLVFPVALVGLTVALVPYPLSTSDCVVEYLMVSTEVVAPFAFTVALRVAVVAVTFVAAWVVTVGSEATDKVIWALTAPAEFWA
jgi:hypothetical protein